MLSFIVGIIFIVQLILFVIVYFLFQNLQQLKKQTPEKTVELLDQYILELKNENKRLEKLLKTIRDVREEKYHVPKHEEIKKDAPAQPQDGAVQHKTKPEKRERFIQHEVAPTKRSTTIVSDDFQIPDHSAVKDHYEPPTLESQVLQLYEKGQSVDDIAKQLKCGKTEAKLIIDMYEKRKQL